MLFKDNISSDDIIQQIINEFVKQQKHFQELQKSNDHLHLGYLRLFSFYYLFILFYLESENNLQSNLNTINELNEELLRLKEYSISSTNKSNLLLFYEELQNILSLSSQSTSEQIICYINNLIKDNNLYKEKEDNLNKNLKYVNEELINVYQQYKQLEESNKNILFEKELINDNIKQDYIYLQNQCTQLDNANKAWQIFYQNQIDLIKNQFKDYFNLNDIYDFNQIIQIILKQFQEKNNSSGYFI